MPADALPEGFINKQRGDWSDVWPFKYIKPSWTAFGPRSRTFGCCWREFPIVLVAVFGRGESRWEQSDGLFAVRSVNTPVFMFWPMNMYLSTIQYWCDWSVILQWPLYFSFHWYTKNKKVRFFRIGARRNADRFYDFPSAHWGEFN